MELPNIYSGDYKKLIAIPIFLAALSLALIFFISPIRLGVDFKGGIDVEMFSDAPPDTQAISLELEKNGYIVNSIQTSKTPTQYITKAELERSQKILQADDIKTDYYELREDASALEAEATFSNDTSVIDAAALARQNLNKIADSMFSLANVQNSSQDYESIHLLTKDFMAAYTQIKDEENRLLRSTFSNIAPDATVSFKERTSSLSASFIDRAIMVVIYSIVLTSIVVFLIFRSPIPSIAVLTGAGADILFALGAMAIFGIPLTLASFAALLMLVGFSLDTDILLTIRVLKRREGTAAERAYGAMKTGTSMSMSTMVAALAILAIAFITHITIYYEIGAVVFAGLIGDLIATWTFNAVILLHHVQDLEKKGKLGAERSLLSYIFRS